MWSRGMRVHASQVAAASASAMILFTTAAASTAFAVAGTLRLDLAPAFVGLGFAATLVGQIAMGAPKRGRCCHSRTSTAVDGRVHRAVHHIHRDIRARARSRDDSTASSRRGTSRDPPHVQHCPAHRRHYRHIGLRRGVDAPHSGPYLMLVTLKSKPFSAFLPRSSLIIDW